MSGRLGFCGQRGNPSSLNFAGATLVGRIQLGSTSNAVKRGKILFSCSEASLRARGSAIYGVLRLAAGDSFVGLAEIAAQLDGRCRAWLRKCLISQLQSTFTRVGFGQRSMDVIAVSSQIGQSGREVIKAVQRNKALNT